jgi:anaphase-promoting complex subunit 3
MLKDRAKRQTSENRYLFAQCCLALGSDKLNEAEQALTTYVSQATGKPEVPGGAAGLYVLGCVYRRSHREKAAIQFFKQR